MADSPSRPLTPRALALDTLAALSRGQYGNLALDTALRRHPLADPDRRLYTALVYGVTERKTSLDYLISRLSDRPVEALDETVRLALRMGLYQLIYMDRIPDHAAINETVSLLPRRTAGYANAVLRSFLRTSWRAPLRESTNRMETWVSLFPDLAQDPLRTASVAYGIPAGLCRVFFDVFGAGKACSVMEAFTHRPPATLRVNTLHTAPARLAATLTEAGFNVHPGLYAPTALRVGEGVLTSLPSFAEGDFFVQDEASQLCTAALDARPGQVVVDVCACPGSKSFGAALDMENCGEIYDFDLHESKLSLVRSGAKRLGVSVITAACRDARDPDPALIGRADRVLCDVPCSGLGVLAKKPEIRHKDLSLSARLPGIQREIMDKSADYLKAGGLMVYSTCTLLPSENREVVADFLAAHPEFEPCPLSFDPLPGQSRPPIRSGDGMVTLLPDEHGTDGFFIAKLKKRGGTGERQNLC